MAERISLEISGRTTDKISIQVEIQCTISSISGNITGNPVQKTAEQKQVDAVERQPPIILLGVHLRRCDRKSRDIQKYIFTLIYYFSLIYTSVHKYIIHIISYQVSKSMDSQRQNSTNLFISAMFSSHRFFITYFVYYFSLIPALKALTRLSRNTILDIFVSSFSYSVGFIPYLKFIIYNPNRDISIAENYPQR